MAFWSAILAKNIQPRYGPGRREISLEQLVHDEYMAIVSLLPEG
jgi:hypothetical protein